MTWTIINNQQSPTRIEREGVNRKMKIGQDEIGAKGVLGLVFIVIGAFLAAYGILSYLLFFLIGIVVLFVSMVVYYQDLLSHRKKSLTLKRRV